MLARPIIGRHSLAVDDYYRVTSTVCRRSNLSLSPYIYII